MTFAVPQIHTHQHLRPVGSVDAAGFGANRDQRFAGVVLAVQQRAHFEFGYSVLQFADFLLGFSE